LGARHILSRPGGPRAEINAGYKPSQPRSPSIRPPGPLTFHVLSGSVTFRTGGRAETLRSGELVVLESAIEHEVEALEESACLLTLAGAS
jgi:quercetin dioxygenase-like cupin family protein